MIAETTVAELKLHPVCPVQAGHDLIHAVSVMSDRGTDCLLVLHQRRPVGLLTERDVLRCAVRGMDFSVTSVREAMSKPCVAVRREMTVLQACRRMSEHRTRHLLVLAEGKNKVSGLLNLSEIVELLVMEYFCSNTPCREIMNQEVARVRPRAALREALLLMESGGAHCVVAVEDDRPVGILTKRDVARLMLESGERQRLEQTQVSKLMTFPVVTAPQEALVYEVAMLQKSKDIRRTALVDAENRLVGMVSQTDIFKGFTTLVDLSATVEDMSAILSGV